MDPNKRRRIGGSDALILLPNVSFDSDEVSTGSSEPLSELTIESVDANTNFARCTGKLPTGSSIFDSVADKSQLEVD